MSFSWLKKLDVKKYGIVVISIAKVEKKYYMSKGNSYFLQGKSLFLYCFVFPVEADFSF